MKGREGHYIEVLPSHKQAISLVHPFTESKENPGIIVDSRSTKPKCHTCKGFKCLHVNIYMEETSIDDKDKNRRKGFPNNETTSSNSEVPLQVKNLDAFSEKCKNVLDPTDKTQNIDCQSPELSLKFLSGNELLQLSLTIFVR